jgi:hypothetical protein
LLIGKNWGPARISRGETSRCLQICIIGLGKTIIKKIRDLKRLSPRDPEQTSRRLRQASASKEFVLSGIIYR